jgi:prophage regulatory protein
MPRSKPFQAEAEAPTPETQIAISPTLTQRDDDELWSIRIVVQKTGLSRASIYRYIARNLFPPRRRIGPGRIAWLASEVLVWMQSRPHPDAHP